MPQSISLKKVKRTAKATYKKARLKYLQRFYAFDRSDLTALLQRLGVNQGDVLLVHSSYEAFGGFTGRVTDAIGSIEDAVGPRGTVLMPAIPFSGSAVEYVEGKAEFNVAKTPSHMGLLTEVFRRSPGTVQSLHPTHSVAGKGPKASTLLQSHEQAGTPCGDRSPYHALLSVQGKIGLIGTTIAAMTFYHTLEELFENSMPECPFDNTLRELVCTDGKGRRAVVRTRLFDQNMSHRRTLDPLHSALRRSGDWREGKVGKLSVVVLDANRVRDACERLIQRNIFCYQGYDSP